MFPQQRFRVIGFAGMLAVVSAAFPLTGYCVAAGNADFVIGNVMAVAADGSRRPLAKGSEINVGDTIDTAAGARAQLRFTDGGRVSLQPGSQFRVDDYRYENKADGSEKGFFSLLKGGLRAITGAIGRVKREAYKVDTPVATIGIRGTGYNAVLGEGLTVSVTDGVVSLTNNGGTLILNQGQSAFVADMNTLPQLTFEKPALPPTAMGGTNAPPLMTTQYVQGDCVGSCAAAGLYSTTGLIVINGVAAVGTGSGWIFGFNVDFPGVLFLDPALREAFYLSSGGVPIDFGGSTPDTTPVPPPVDPAPPFVPVPVFGYDGVIGWGRFYGLISTGAGPITLTPNQGLHTAVGIPSASMPTAGTGTYALIGATRPTLSTGAWAPGTVTGGSLSVNFANSTISGDLTFDMNNTSFSMIWNGTASGTRFSLTSASVTGCPATGCAAAAAGFFAGGGASRAGMVYQLGGGGLPGTIDGAAAFSQTAAVAAVQ